MADNTAHVSVDVSTFPVVITIARDFGAEGHEIGKMLSNELGIPLYDNELLVRASLRAGVTTDQIAAYDESLAAEVSASDYILRDNPNCINVLVTAPLDVRTEIVRAKRNITEKKAKKLVKRMQRARELFYKRYSAGKWSMHEGKDLVVNRARFGRQGCCDIIAAAYRAKVAAVERARQSA